MSFGDLPLLSYSMHTSSLISRSHVQLLVLDSKDFYDTFVNSKPSDRDSLSRNKKKSSVQENIDFLSQNAFFKDWPLHLFEQNPQAIKTCVWARNKIISKGSHLSKYIYVIKRGYM